MKRDVTSVDILNRQILPEFPKFIRSVLSDVSVKKYQFVLIDNSSQQDERFRFRNFVYPKKDAKIYVPTRVIKKHSEEIAGD